MCIYICIHMYILYMPLGSEQDLGRRDIGDDAQQPPQRAP